MPHGISLKTHRFLGCALAMVLCCAPADAASYTWIGSPFNDYWDDSWNWSPPSGVPPSSSTTDVRFGDTDYIPTSYVNHAWTIHSLMFDSGAPGYSLQGSELSIYSGGITNLSSAPQHISNSIRLFDAQEWNAANGSLVLGNVNTNGFLLTLTGSFDTGITIGPVSGTGGLHKMGTGTLSLYGSNIYTGGTTVDAGTLQIGFPGGSASLKGNILNNAAVVFWQAGMYTGNISGTGTLTKSGTGQLTLTGVNSYTGGTTVSGGILYGCTDNIKGRIVLGGGTTVTFDQSFDGICDGNISGGGILTKRGTGKVTLSGTNIYSGGTTLYGGTLSVSAPSNVGTGTVTFATPATIQVTGAAAATLRNYFDLDATATFDISSTGATTITGSISGWSAGLVKTGPGTLILTGSNSYSGGTTIGTTINEGVLGVSSDSNLGGSGSRITFGGGTLRLGASFNPSSSRAITLNAAGGTIDTNGFNTTVASVISGAGGLTKTGAGTLTLSGTNTYSGGTTVNEGTLSITSDANLGASGKPVTLDDATIKLGASLGSWTRPIALGAGGSTVNTNGFGAYQTGVINGSGGLTKAGNGTLTLVGANTYTGGTIILGGTLESNSNSLQGAVTNSSAPPYGLVLNQESGTSSIDGVFSGNISGTGRLTKRGSGSLTLTGVNTYTGGTKIEEGYVFIKSGDNIGAGLVTVDLTGGGGSSVLQINASLPTIFSNDVALNATGASLVLNNSAEMTVSGRITGTGAVSHRGGGLLILTGPNIYSGGTHCRGAESSPNRSGLLVAPASSALGSGLVTVSGRLGDPLHLPVDCNAGGLVFSGQALQFSNAFLLDHNSALFAGSPRVPGSASTTVTLIGDVEVDYWPVLRGTGSGTIMGTVSGSGALVKADAGVWTLSGANTYDRGTDVFGGTLVGTARTSGSPLGSGDLVVEYGTFRLEGISADTNTSTANLLATGGGTLAINNTDSAYTTTLSAASLSRSAWSMPVPAYYPVSFTLVREGTLVIQPVTGNLATKELLTFTKAPTLTNGIMSPWAVAQASGTDSAADFLTHSGNSTPVTPFNAYKTGDINAAGATDVYRADEAQNLSADRTVYALKSVGAVIDTGGHALTVGNGAGQGGIIINGGEIRDGTLAFGAAEGVIYTSSDGAAISSTVTGSAGLTTLGPGTLTVLGPNSYTGPTMVAAGTLKFGAANVIPSASAVTLGLEARLDLNGFDWSPGSIGGGGEIALSGGAVLTLGAGDTSVAYDGTVSGNGGIVKIGTGALVLSGSSTYTGGTIVSGGILYIEGDDSLGAPTSGLTIAGATLYLDGDFTLHAARPVILDDPGATVVSPSASVVAGVISGGGSLTKNGSGTLTVSNTNAYTGGTTVSAGTFAGVAQTTGSPFGSGAIAVGDATLQLNGIDTDTDTALPGLTFRGASRLAINNTNSAFGTMLSVGSLVRDGWAVLVIEPTSGQLGTREILKVAAAPPVTNGIVSPWVVAQISGADEAADFVTYDQAASSVLRFSAYRTGGINTAGPGDVYGAIGNETLSADRAVYALKMGKNSSINATGRTLTVGDGSSQAGIIMNGASIAGGTLAFGAAEAVIYAGSQRSVWGDPANSISSIITGTGGLTIAGDGGLKLSGANTYTGPTTILGGARLQCGRTNTLPATSSLNVASGAVIALDHYDQSVGSLSGEGAVDLSGGCTLTVGADNTSTTFSGQIWGGNLVKVGSGILTLNSPGSGYASRLVIDRLKPLLLPVVYMVAIGDSTSGIVVSSGTVKAEGDYALPSGDVTVQTGATLDLNGYDQWVGSISGAGEIRLGAGRLDTYSDTSTAFSGSISGNGHLTKGGTGSLELASDNLYTGSTSVWDGALIVSNATGSGTGTGPVTVGTATLGGTGFINGPVTLTGDSTLTSTGTLTINNTLTVQGLANQLEAGTVLTSGDVTIDPGAVFIINGTLGGDLGSLIIHGTLMGKGTINKLCIIEAGGMLSPGSPSTIQSMAQILNAEAPRNFSFEIGAAEPNYASPSNSLNDLIRLTNEAAPFADATGSTPVALTADTVIDVYFLWSDPALGEYKAEFFAASDFTEAISDATFRYWRLDPRGACLHNGNFFSPLDSSLVDWSVVPETATFNGAPSSGYITEFTVVPEPAALALLALGSLALLSRRRK